jgi:hypothetical protein
MERKEECVNIILPNLRVKDRNIYFILEDTYILVDEIKMEDEIIVEFEDQITTIHYELLMNEDSRGLRCRIGWLNSFFYEDDIRNIGKWIELNIMGMNSKNTYQLVNVKEELKKKKRNKKIPMRKEEESD